MKNNFALLAIYILFISSCVQKESNKAKETIVKDTKEEVEIKKEITKKEVVTIDIILSKLENKHSLSSKEYEILFQNIKRNDESISEGLGYLLYEYFYRDNDKEENLKDYLSDVNKDERDAMINLLLKSMCLELMVNEYESFEKVITDFKFIKDNEKNRNTFNICFENNKNIE